MVLRETVKRDPPERVRVRGWRWVKVGWCAFYAALGIGVGILFGDLEFGFDPQFLVLGPLLFIGLVLLPVFLVTWINGVREVTASAEAVEFVLGRETVRVGWDELRPPKYPVALGDVHFYFPEENGPFHGPSTTPGRIAVTKKQAQAILAHSSCPTWALPEAVRRSLAY
jgi:hypothetical protein